MPSFDIVSEIDRGEVDNALNQARKEMLTRFDFKGSTAEVADMDKNGKIELNGEDANRVKAILEIVLGKLAKRNVDLRNVEREEPSISSVGHCTQQLVIRQGLEGEKAKEIIQSVKAQQFKVQCALQDRQVRVTGKKRDDLQAVIAFLRSQDYEVALGFKNFRD